MLAADNYKQMARHITTSLVHHIQKEVGNKNPKYMQLGIDGDFDTYKAYSELVISRALGTTKNKDSRFPEITVRNSVKVVKEEIKIKGYGKLLKNPILADFMIKLCNLVLELVIKESRSLDFNSIEQNLTK
ncbi:hypothetical protein [Alkalihalophilus marmarensis]|uniref:Uncharacterized protein n=1 Tax=Alkalihalophilus marmarensis DSM 21297 TaxID=1188261 RepID=U6SL30_9BACI|nr:hypothetical protein [Alkalihalophilus marmarensis]ERN51630.1 hypothetical protein A33I_20060 [Alkalihalophilus marmarensis DSM 21297]